MAQGVSDIRGEALAHLRYDGSHQPLPVPFGSAIAMQRAFEAAHQARFGFTSPERAIWFEMLSCEAIGTAGELPDMVPPKGRPQQLARAGGFAELGRCHCGTAPRLPAGWTCSGPAIITETTGTNVVEPGWQARIDGTANLILERVEAAAPCACCRNLG